MNNSFLYYQRNEDKPSICSSTVEGTKTNQSICSSTIEGTKTNQSICSSIIEGTKTSEVFPQLSKERRGSEELFLNY
jgi:hypothetical protein